MTQAFLCEGLRTPIGRYGGALSGVRPDDMLAGVIAAVVALAPGLDPSVISDVIMGNANGAGEDNRNVARMATLLAGLPNSIPGMTMNRLCGSGLNAVGVAAQAIRAGDAEVILAGGVESMSRAPFVIGKATSAFDRNAQMFDTTIGWRFINKQMKAQYGVDSMPETAENVAEEYQISREAQDAFAYRSQVRAAAAIASGRFKQEITPVSIAQRKGDPIVVDTVGNASGVNDGAAAIIIASGAAVEKYGLIPKARIAGMMCAGVPPRIMGIGPAPASQMLMERMGLTISDIDIIELNEAFAAQGLAVMRELGLPDDAAHVNPNGGAIALGHPLGMSGARLALTAAIEMVNTDANRALCTMCIGVGQGIALMLEKV
jgi:acetyl-CoA acyltransferase